MAHSMYNLEFKRDANEVELCKATIKSAEIKQLQDAIEDLYYFEFVLDDLPIRGFIGHFEEGGIAPLHQHKVHVNGPTRRTDQSSDQVTDKAKHATSFRIVFKGEKLIRRAMLNAYSCTTSDVCSTL